MSHYNSSTKHTQSVLTRSLYLLSQLRLHQPPLGNTKHRSRTMLVRTPHGTFNGNILNLGSSRNTSCWNSVTNQHSPSSYSVTTTKHHDTPAHARESTETNPGTPCYASFPVILMSRAVTGVSQHRSQPGSKRHHRTTHSVHNLVLHDVFHHSTSLCPLCVYRSTNGHFHFCL